MEWERLQQQLLRANLLVAQAERCVGKARRAVQGARYGDTCSINADQALKTLEAVLEDGIDKRDRLRDRLRLLTH